MTFLSHEKTTTDTGPLKWYRRARLLSSNSAQPLQVATQSRRRQPALIDRHRRSNPLCTATAQPATSERRTKVRRSSDAPTPIRTPARPAHDSRLTNDDSHLTPCPSTPTPPQNKAPNGAAQISAQCVSAGKTNTSNQTSPERGGSTLPRGLASDTTPLHTRNPTSPVRTRTVGVDRCVHPSTARRHADRSKPIASTPGSIAQPAPC